MARFPCHSLQLGEPEGTAIHLPAASNGSDWAMTPTNPFGHHHFPTHGVQSYDMVVQQTPQWQTTCYVGNLTPYTSQNDLVLSSRTSVMFLRHASSRPWFSPSSRWILTRMPAMAICQTQRIQRQRPALEVQCMSSPLYPLNLVY